MTTNQAVNVEETLKKIVTKITRKENVAVTLTTTFKDLGADSLDVVQILVALEEAFDIELVDEELKALNNMGQFVGYVKQKIAAKK